MYKKLLLSLVLLMIFLTISQKSFALSPEDVIKKHNLDMSKEEDRCSLLRVIEKNYPDIFHDKNVIENYFGPVGNYSKDMFVKEIRDIVLPLNNSIISVYKDLDKNYNVANFNFVGSNLILKLKNGNMISNIYQGYIVPFDFLRLDKDYKITNKLAVLQSYPPRGNIKYFHVEKCLVSVVNN